MECGGEEMSITVFGVVRNGIVVPDFPLPEGAVVEIVTHETPVESPREFQEELAGWQLGSAQALELVEKLAEEMEKNETR
jgi:hypothetical protein